MTQFVENDGGRAAAGYKGDAGDCVVRAVAIATEDDYESVYRELGLVSEWYADNRRDKVAKAIRLRGPSPRNGVFTKVVRTYMEDIGWSWVPTMGIGTGCKVHLKAAELPQGRIICKLTKHMTAVVDGVINDTYDPSRGGTRCVYGYFQKD